MNSTAMKPFRRVACFAASLLFAGVFLRAQDITIQGPQWPPEGEQPDEIPVAKRPSKPDVPDALKKAVEPYYTFARHSLDQAGKLRALSNFFSHPALEKIAQETATGWKFKPALKSGQPVATRVWTAVIANPASASPKGLSATPRLLEIAPIEVPKSIFNGRKGHQIVRTKITLDPAGAVLDLALESPMDEIFLEAIKASVAHWRFAPARHEGRAVPAELSMGLIVTMPIVAVEYPTPPKALHQARPEYPVAMSRSGLKGGVTVEFVIMEDGSVQNPVVKKSNHPAFDEPAIEAILKWKFAPGKKNGKPVKVHAQQLIEFSLPQMFDGGNDAFVVNEKSTKAQEKIPAQYRYDAAPKPIGTVAPVFPYAQLSKGGSGQATIVVLLDAQGLAAATRIISASQPEFGLALAAAFDAFAFEPATRDGKPTSTLLNMVHEFSTGGQAGEDRSLLRSLEKHPERIVPATKLDVPLKPLSRRPPVYPRKEEFKSEAGEAVIEFVVDAEGKVRLPRIVSATQPEFGYAAVQAISVWRFEPPKSGGKTVVTRAIIPIQFAPEKIKPAPEVP